MSLQEFINNNHRNLLQACKNIKYDLYGELYSELYIYLDKQWDKYGNLPEKEIYYLSIDFLKKQIVWETSQLNLLMKPTRLKSLTIEYTNEVPELPFNDLSIELGADAGTKFTEEYLLDLSNHFNEEQMKCIIKTYLVYDKLNLKDQIIFDLYIQQGLSMRDIAKKIDTSFTSARIIILNTIKNIKQLIENDTINN